MIIAAFNHEMHGEKLWNALCAAFKSAEKISRYLLSSALLSIASARAEAPAPSQEFWNYFVEFGDAQGELFDPSDYSAVVNIPAKVKQEIESNPAARNLQKVPSEKDAAQEQSK